MIRCMNRNCRGNVETMFFKIVIHFRDAKFHRSDTAIGFPLTSSMKHNFIMRPLRFRDLASFYSATQLNLICQNMVFLHSQQIQASLNC